LETLSVREYQSGKHGKKRKAACLVSSQTCRCAFTHQNQWDDALLV